MKNSNNKNQKSATYLAIVCLVVIILSVVGVQKAKAQTQTISEAYIEHCDTTVLGSVHYIFTEVVSGIDTFLVCYTPNPGKLFTGDKSILQEIPGGYVIVAENQSKGLRTLGYWKDVTPIATERGLLLYTMELVQAIQNIQ